VLSALDPSSCYCFPYCYISVSDNHFLNVRRTAVTSTWSFDSPSPAIKDRAEISDRLGYNPEKLFYKRIIMSSFLKNLMRMGSEARNEG